MSSATTTGRRKVRKHENKSTSGPAKKPSSKKQVAARTRRAEVLAASAHGHAQLRAEADPAGAAREVIGPDRDLGDAMDDDPDSFSPASEYGEDPLFDDGDFSETDRRENEWDRGDSSPNPVSSSLQVMPDLAVWPASGAKKWRVVLLMPSYVPFTPRQPSTVPASHESMKRDLAIRDDRLQALASEIITRQARFLETGDPVDLTLLRQADLARFLGVHDSVVMRLLSESTIELPDGAILPLEELLADSDRVRIGFIKALLREKDEVERDAQGRVRVLDLLPLSSRGRSPSIRSKVREEFGEAGSSESNLRRIMRDYLIPSDPRKRRRCYEEGGDWWTCS